MHNQVRLAMVGFDHPNIIIYAHKRRYPWDEHPRGNATKSGHLNSPGYLYQNGHLAMRPTITNGPRRVMLPNMVVRAVMRYGPLLKST